MIRIAPDVLRQARGMSLATKVRDLWNQGCDIKIGYTVMGIDVGRFLRIFTELPQDEIERLEQCVSLHAPCDTSQRDMNMQ